MSNNTACFPVTMDTDPQTGEPSLVLNQITKIRMADGRQVGIVDWAWRPQYSVIDTLSGWTDNELRAFQYSQGDPITISSNMSAQESATLTHTNITSPAEMDALEEFLVYAMCVEVYWLTEVNASSITDAEAGQPIPFPNNIARLQRACIVELEVSDKDYQQASFGWFPPGFGVYGFGGPDAGRMYAQNGTPSREAVDLFPVPTHIGGTEKFAVILHNADGTAITYRTEAGAEDADGVHRLRFNLMGLHKRPTG